jgi:hypothetical protein
VPTFIRRERISPWTAASSSRGDAGGAPNDGLEQRSLEGHGEMSLLEHHPVGRDAGPRGDIGDDRRLVEVEGNPGRSEPSAKELRHLRGALAVGRPERGIDADRGRRRLPERVHALAAEVHPAGIRRVVDADAGGTERFDHGDQLDAVQRDDAGGLCGGAEAAVDPQIVEVRGAEDRHALLRRGVDGVLDVVER